MRYIKLLSVSSVKVGVYFVCIVDRQTFTKGDIVVMNHILYIHFSMYIDRFSEFKNMLLVNEYILDKH